MPVKTLSQKEIQRELDALEKEEMIVLSQIKEYVDNHGSEFFKPFPHQQKAIDLLWEGKKVLVLQGGNQIGKTVFGANMVSSFALGYQPWDKKESIFEGRSTRGRILCSDWEHHANEVIVPEMKKWLPKGSWETRKNNAGTEAFWHFPANGSTIELVTNKQDTKDHEGWKGDYVWADEPSSWAKYSANKRGLLVSNGVFILTMTALYEPWILDEIVLANKAHIGIVGDVPMKANPLLSQEDIDNYESDLPPEEREARIRGGWLQLAGKVLKGFDREKHVIEPFEIPADWPVTVLIDLHLSTKQAVGFYATDKYGNNYVIDEVWENISPELVADRIVKKKMQNSWNIREVLIDPLAKGDSLYLKNRMGKVEDSYSIIERSLAKAKIRLDIASKDKDSGIRNIADWLEGANKRPTLFFFRNCEMHMYEINRWTYDSNGKPKKENDHFMENLYRYTLAGVKYKERKPLAAYDLSKQRTGTTGRSSAGWLGV